MSGLKPRFCYLFSCRRVCYDTAEDMNSWMVIFFSLFLSSKSFAVEYTLRYDRLLAKLGFASPLVDIFVNGKKGTFLVDSGAPFTLISKQFAIDIGIEPINNGLVGGSAGGSTSAEFAKVDLSLISSEKKSVSYKGKIIALVPLPEDFHTNGISGIMSPQSFLAENEICILDLKSNPSIVFLNSNIPSQYTPISVIPSGNTPESKTFLYTVNAQIDGVETKFIVDTGAENVSVGINSLPGKKLLRRSVMTNEKVGGINGKSERIRSIANAKMKLFKHYAKIKIRLQPTSDEMPADGMLGMKFLMDCSLALGQIRAGMLCK